MLNLDSMTMGELEETQKVLNELHQYAAFKESAQYQRLVGNIEQAQHLEGTCDVIYDRLPEWARW